MMALSTLQPYQQNSPICDMNQFSYTQIQNQLSCNGKLKNQLCRNYLQNGFCKYEHKCQFAHGIDELRQHQNINNKYKTKKCLSFFSKGHCMYGERCNFQHIKKQQNTHYWFSKAVQRNYREIFFNTKTRSSLVFNKP